MGLTIVTTSSPALASFGFLDGPRATVSNDLGWVVWENEQPGDGRVYYGLDPGTLTIEASDGTEGSFSHWVDLGGLTPATQYFYQVRSHGQGGEVVAESDILTFTTAASGTNCSFDPVPRWLTVFVEGTATLEATPSGFLLGGTPCAGATPTNTDNIHVYSKYSSSDALTLIGTFGPGVEVESGTSEIEIQLHFDTSDSLEVVLGAADDNVLFNGFGGIDVGGDDIWDIYLGVGATATGRVTVWGGAGNDIIDASAYDRFLTLQGQGGHDILVGGIAEDRLYGGAGNDDLDGGPGNDLFSGGAGADVLDGGNGIDRFLEGTAANGADLFVGGAGRDTVDYGDRSQTLAVAIGDGANDGELGELDDVSADVENVTGGSAADTLVGSSANNVLRGGAGADTLAGGLGTDTLWGDDGGDTLMGDGGPDTLQGGTGDDSLIGSNGADTLVGGPGNDAFYAGAGNDQIFNQDGLTGESVDCGTGTDDAEPEADELVGCEL